MEKFSQILKEQTPKTTTIPSYYHLAFRWVYGSLIFLFAVITLITCFWGVWRPTVFMVFLVVCLCLLAYNHRNISGRLNLILYLILVSVWMGCNVFLYGWGTGSQLLLVPLLITVFFSVFESMRNKIIYLIVILVVRSVMFYFSMGIDPVIVPAQEISLLIQVLNAAVCYFQIAVLCIIFSSNIQKSEKELLIHNEELQEEAATDPLTRLYNRRAMLEFIENHIKAFPEDGFSVAMGDIDLFKKVNDTYGHDCGDYVLKELADLFRRVVGEKGTVSRWGGEEFLFFLPNMNVDEAGALMTELRFQIAKKEFTYQEITLNVTMTFGVEEWDFRSDMSKTIKGADDKLYLGKTQGRNLVII